MFELKCGVFLSRNMNAQQNNYFLLKFVTRN